MEHVLSLSYGKDSIACLGAIAELGLPLDRIITCDVMATDTIYADLPPMVEFKAYADKIIKSRYGYSVEHIRSKWTYEKYFYRPISSHRNSRNAGHINGFPLVKGSWCNSRLKVSELQKHTKNCISYLGIAYDEPKRWKVLNDNKISPLVLAKWTEIDCYKWCEKNDLLSPVYKNSFRGGCWFCHFQGVEQLRFLYYNYPEYWNLLLKWDKDSFVTFKPNNTVADYDKRFRLEDEGLIFPDDSCFRWNWLDGNIQLKFFA